MSQARRITVTVDPAHIGAISSVARSLQDEGMHVDEVLAMGFITGTVDPAAESALGAIPGVASIDPSTDYQLPAPDSDVQ